MKKIKFRGKSLYSEKYFFGGYYKDCSDVEFIVQPSGEMNRVDSVSQFIGYDMNNEEVYDDDTLISYEGIAVEAIEALNKWNFGDMFKDYVLWK